MRHTANRRQAYSPSHNVEAALNYEVLRLTRESYRLANVLIRVKNEEQNVRTDPRADEVMPRMIEVKKRLRQGFEVFISEGPMPGQTGVRDRTCFVVRNLDGFKRMVEAMGWPKLVSVRTMSTTEVELIARWVKENVNSVALGLMDPDRVVSDFGNVASPHVATLQAAFADPE